MPVIKLFLSIVAVFIFYSCTAPTNNNMESIDDNSPKDFCCSNDTTNTQTVMQSEITCPNCGHKKMEVMPTDVCVIRYNCEQCNTELLAKDGDCCVFCSYGTHKCPSMQ